MATQCELIDFGEPDSNAENGMYLGEKIKVLL